MRKRSTKRRFASSGKDRPQAEDAREGSRRSIRILGGVMSFLLGPSPARPGPANTVDADTAASNILAGVRRRKGGGKKRRGIPAAAGIVVLFSALCATLLWGVGSFSHRPAVGGAGANSTRDRGSEGKARASATKTAAAAAAAAARATTTSATKAAESNSKSDSPAAASRNLARRPELKTRGGQLAFARFTLLAEYPHDSTAFTQGLCFDGGFLYESTGLFGGKSTVRKVKVETGEVLQSVKLGDKYFGEGMVIVQDKIHSLTWRSGVGFSWDLETFQPKGEFKFSTKTGQGWGITSDGSSLIVSDGSEYLHFWDPVTMNETRRVAVTLESGKPLTRINELEMVQGYLLANVWFDEHLYKIDPATGKVLDSYDFAELYPKALQKKELSSRDAVLNGIAWDPEEDVLYLTGKLWPRMYKVKLRDHDDDDSEEGPELTGSEEEGNERRQP